MVLPGRDVARQGRRDYFILLIVGASKIGVTLQQPRPIGDAGNLKQHFVDQPDRFRDRRAE
jgi:hypothetical protein